MCYSSYSLKHLLKVGPMLFICRLAMYIPIPLSYSSKAIRPEPNTNKITPLMALQLFMKVALTALLNPTPEVYILLVRLLILLYTSIESTATLRFSTLQVGITAVGLVGLLTVGSMVLMWMNEHINMDGLGGSSLVILFRLLAYVPSGLLLLKTSIGKNPTASFLFLTVLGLLVYFSILTELTSQRLTAWHQMSDRKHTSYCYVKLVPVSIFPLALAGVTAVLQVSLAEKICVVCGSYFKWMCIQDLIKPIETSCDVLTQVGLMVYFCVIVTRWDVKTNYGSSCLKRSGAIIGFLRSGLKPKEYLAYIFRDIYITKTLCIALGCGVIRLLSLFTKQSFVLTDSSFIVLIAASLVLTEHLKFYANFIQCLRFFKTC
ncbi:hypothetical protein [Candidatus Tremblaya phenacola]|nr:hypothetical protein [Candidatus Tremblaya phenacola]